MNTALGQFFRDAISHMESVFAGSGTVTHISGERPIKRWVKRKKSMDATLFYEKLSIITIGNASWLIAVGENVDQQTVGNPAALLAEIYVYRLSDQFVSLSETIIVSDVGFNNTLIAGNGEGNIFLMHTWERNYQRALQDFIHSLQPGSISVETKAQELARHLYNFLKDHS